MEIFGCSCIFVKFNFNGIWIDIAWDWRRCCCQVFIQSKLGRELNWLYPPLRIWVGPGLPETKLSLAKQRVYDANKGEPTAAAWCIWTKCPAGGNKVCTKCEWCEIVHRPNWFSFHPMKMQLWNWFARHNHWQTLVCI